MHDWKNVKIIIFDLDGTLIDSVAGTMKAYIYAFTRMNIEPPPEKDIRTLLVYGLMSVFSKYINEGRLDEAVGFYREYYRTKSIFEAVPYDGITEALAALKFAGKTLLIATMKQRDLAEEQVNYCLGKFFEAVYGIVPEARIDRKQDIISLILKEHGLSACDAVMVGDRHNDVTSASTNGVASIGVLWGYGSETELRGAGALAIAQQPCNLIDLILDNENSSVNVGP